MQRIRLCGIGGLSRLAVVQHWLSVPRNRFNRDYKLGITTKVQGQGRIFGKWKQMLNGLVTIGPSLSDLGLTEVKVNVAFWRGLENNLSVGI